MSKEDQETFGLKEDWDSVEETLQQIIPVYDRTNRFISLGTDLKVRRRGLSLLLQKAADNGQMRSFSVLDLGSGPGKMTELLRALVKSPDQSNIARTIMLDALCPMLKKARSRNPESEGILGVYESIPMKSQSIDVVVAGFAIRDAKNLLSALQDVSRVLRPGGLFLIVDLCKPNSRLNRAIIGSYWRTVAPLLAFIAAGRTGLKFGALSKTYHRLPTKSEFVNLFQKSGLESVEAEYSMFGGVCVLLLRKLMV